MNKKLLAHQLDRIRNLPPGESCQFTLEEAGVLKAFVETRRKAGGVSAGENALHGKIQLLLGAWEETPSAKAPRPRAGGRERRTQVALRGAMDKVLQGRWRELSGDDIRLLRGTHRIFSNRHSSGTGRDDRLMALLADVIKKCDEHEARRAKGSDAPGGRKADLNGAPTDGAPTVFGALPVQEGHGPAAKTAVRNRVSTDKEFREGRATHLSVLEEISTDIHVRTFQFEGETALAGDVPGDVLVKVADGGVVVDGFVAGNIVASGDITVNGNVQGGWLISTGGNIFVERCLIGSKLVAKSGNVSCRHAEAPERVFAWGRVEVDGPLLGGVVCGGHIEVKGKVMSGELHSCGEIRASSFEVGGRSATVICLRPSLTCEDYGRSMSKTVHDLLRKLNELEMKIAMSKQLNQFTNQLIHICHRTSLFYLLGGVESASSAVDLQGLQVKSAHLGQLVAVAEGVRKYYGSVMENAGDPDPDEVARFQDESHKSIALIKKGVEGLPDELGTIHRRYVLDRCSELRALVRELHSKSSEPEGASFLRERFTKTLSEWQGTWRDSERTIGATIQKLGIEPATLEQMEHQPESIEGMIEKRLAEIQATGSISDRQRTKSPLVRLLKESAKRYRRSIQHSQDSVESAEKERDDILAALKDDAAVLYGDTRPGACSVRAARYDQGVVLTATPGKTQGLESNMAEVIVIGDPITSETVFRFKEKMIQRQL